MIRAGRPDFAVAWLRDNPERLHDRVRGNQTLLLVTACAGQHALADQLMAMGAKIDFISAIILRRIEVARAMLAADPNLVFRHSPDRWGALHLAARYAVPELLELLLSAGADVTDRSHPQRFTPLLCLHQALSECRTPVGQRREH